MYMVAALSLKRSTSAIGTWSGSRGFTASARAALLPPAIKEPIISNAIRMFIVSSPRRRPAHLKRVQRAKALKRLRPPVPSSLMRRLQRTAMNGWSAFSGQTTLRRSLGFGLLLFIITLPGLVDDIRVNCIDVRLAENVVEPFHAERC